MREIPLLLVSFYLICEGGGSYNPRNIITCPSMKPHESIRHKGRYYRYPVLTMGTISSSSAYLLTINFFMPKTESERSATDYKPKLACAKVTVGGAIVNQRTKKLLCIEGIDEEFRDIITWKTVMHMRESTSIGEVLKSVEPTCPIEPKKYKVEDDLVAVLRNDEDENEMNMDVLFIDFISDDAKTTNTNLKSHFLERCKRYSIGTNHRQRIHEKSIIRESYDFQEIISKMVRTQKSNTILKLKMITGGYYMEGTEESDEDYE